METPIGYIFGYKGEQYFGYKNIARRLGITSAIVQYWLNKTQQSDHFLIKDVRIEIIRKGTFEKQAPKHKYYNKNKATENEVRILGNLKLFYSKITGKLIKTESI